MKYIDRTSVMTAIARMMGKRSLPQGNNDDWEDYAQFALDYAWRYYRWDWSLRTVDVDMDTDPYLPDDFDMGGYRKAQGSTTGEIKELPLLEYVQQPSGLRNFAIEFDPDVNKYKVLSTSGLSTITFVYQIEPPTLTDRDDDGEYIQVPFPSAMTIGIGASVYSKQGENPTRADISQEWDEFHAELDRHVGRMDWNAPRRTNLNLQDEYGTYTGDVRV